MAEIEIGVAVAVVAVAAGSHQCCSSDSLAVGRVRVEWKAEIVDESAPTRIVAVKMPAGADWPAIAMTFDGHQMPQEVLAEPGSEQASDASRTANPSGRRAPSRRA